MDEPKVTPELKEITLVFKEQENKRISVECSVPFNDMKARIEAGEKLEGADAMVYFTLCYLIEQMAAATPKPPPSKIITPSRLRVVNPPPKLVT